jgi:phosphoglycolate phosphatase-like HAD superfamily hydrolase
MRAIILDVDGTLLDTNLACVEAWRRAFLAEGFDVPRAAIWAQVGNGGAGLVSDLIGEAAAREIGPQVRASFGHAFAAIARQMHFRFFPGVLQLFRYLARRRVPRAIVTSSAPAQLQAALTSARLDLSVWFAHVFTASEGAARHPAADLFREAIAVLGARPEEALVIGDTRYDADAARQAGAAFVGLTCGGASRVELIASGAGAVFRDAAELVEHLDWLLPPSAEPAPSSRAACGT